MSEKNKKKYRQTKTASDQTLLLLPQRPISFSGLFESFKCPSEKTIRKILIACFFFSGACGLIYEVAWLRVMGIVFGNTTFAVSTVIAAYMAGLGVGALYGGKRVSLSGHPIWVYGKLEGAIGIYALLTPFIWKAIDFLTIFFYQSFTPVFYVGLLFKFIIAFSALLFPTFMMGATLPVLSKFFVNKNEETARDVGLLYGLNTLGAVGGVCFSGFIALEFLGVWQTVYLTAFLNFIIFFICRQINRTQIKEQPTQTSATPATGHDASSSALSPANNRLAVLLLILFGISGATSMIYEVSWTRILAMTVGSSVYAFSIMLATFLLGISLGSYVFSLCSKYIKIGLHTFAFLQILTALSALCGINIFNDMPYYFVQVFAAAKGNLWLLESGKFLLCSIVMLPPTLCIGAMFACFIHIFRRSKSVEQEVGEAYFANTLGTILGSTLTGFLIIPLMGIQNTLLLGAGLNLGIGIITFILSKKNKSWKPALSFILIFALSIVQAAFVKPWNHGFISSDLIVKPQRALGISKKDLLASMRERELLFYKEGLSATVTVTKVRDNISLSVNGKVDASNEDNFTQFLLGHLPIILHPHAEKVLVIGHGSGSSAAAAAAHPVKQIDVIELEKAVVDASLFFTELNRDVLNDPRVHLHVNDGRNFVMTTKEKYDVIISEPSNPWMAGVANLFSYEHYQNMSRKLNSGGIVCQWLHAYSMSPEDLRMITRTFSEVYPHVSLWTSYYPDLILIGKNEPLSLDYQSLQQSFKNKLVLKDLKPHGIQDAGSFLASAWIFDQALRRLGGNAKIHSDNHPRLEFSAPRSLYRDTLKTNYLLLSLQKNADSLPEIKNLPIPLTQNVGFYNSLARGHIAKRAFPDAEKNLRIASQIDSTNLETIILTAITYYAGGYKDRAENLLQFVLRIQPDHAEALYQYGRILQDKGKEAEAVEAFHASVRSETANADHLVTLANALFKTNQHRDALQFFNQALEIRPNDFDSQVKRCLIMMNLDSAEEKISAVKNLNKRYPKFLAPYEWLGNLYEIGGQLDSALETYEAMAEKFPHESSAHIHLARLYDKLGKKSEVKKHVLQAVKANPELKKNSDIQKILRS